ncbi:HAD family hydrolase [Methylophaga sp. OBS3]|uniref:HAD family hydrolase n=1 Tax=Methylophaga sp. OBS3 TaxID=2991934 RepID=UPI0022527699|nr:HAD family hydrolase [Methylophaga sp. OBS3]MCX4189784.1 HAD family hydrolase [Methylophaga sp. OBS3]
MSEKTLYALDFDGVICDSAQETGLSAWLAAQEIWPSLPETIPEHVLSGFKQVRPALETGFEAILICRRLYDGQTTNSLLNNFSEQIDIARQQSGLTDEALKSIFGRVRDNWINEDFAGWIANNPLYPGLAALLLQIPTPQLYIITTKQERFVKAILAANGIELSADQIFGLERKQSKTAILTTLSQDYPEICFVEDRLPTLIDVSAEPALTAVSLWLADWGYNTTQDKQTAKSVARLKSISLETIDRLLQ